MQRSLERSAEIVRRMKEEHGHNQLRKMMCQDIDGNLALMVDIDIQKPLKGVGYGILLPDEKDEDETGVQYIS